MASDTYHEPLEELSSQTRDTHRAITTLIEELEAIDWYQQRAEACTDDELRAVLVHNKNEEIEHAMMTLEWLRRSNADFARHIATYLFTDAPITKVEAEVTSGAGEGSSEDDAPEAPSTGGAQKGSSAGGAQKGSSAGGAQKGSTVGGGASGLGIGSLKVRV